MIWLPFQRGFTTALQQMRTMCVSTHFNAYLERRMS
jgi:hypothetical protein